MKTALIIDDEFHAQEGLKRLIQLTFPSLLDQIFLADSVDQGVEIIRQNKPDLIFLDIHLQNEYGFKLFDYFDEIDFEVVFTTAHSNYVMEAVNQWGCLGYLMKPVSISDLKFVIARFKDVFQAKQTDKETVSDLILNDEVDENKEIKATLNQENGILLFSSVNEINFIKVKEIIYCKADDNYCEINTIKKTYTISRPLKEVEKAINRNSFVRVHRSYLVNMEFAERLDKKSNTLFLCKTKDCNEEVLIPVTASGIKILMNAIS